MPGKERDLAVIGAGAMGQALIRGLIDSGVYQSSEIVASDADKARLAQFCEETGVDSAGNVEAASSSEVIIIAVKPSIVPEVMEVIAGHVLDDQLVISIAAGVKIDKISGKLQQGTPVIRAMPNTPCLVGAGAIALSRGKHATNEHIAVAAEIFQAVGKVIEVPERLLDAVTGLSGSGPAYVYLIIEALADAGVLEGLARDQAMTLAAQTVFGAAKMVIETGEHPSVLRDLVASPGGTTIAGVAALERSAVRAGLIEAVEAASHRSRELSNPRYEQDK